MKIDLALIQQLREKTGVGMMDCKKALEEANGDLEKAVELLRKKGAAVALKRSGNATAEGIIHAYIHPGARIGVLIEINCETDFVARTEDMKKFAQELCMHIAAAKPLYVRPEEADAAFIEKERKLYKEQLTEEGKKPANIGDTVSFDEVLLRKVSDSDIALGQPFVKNDKLTVDDVLKELIAKMGENIKIKRFAHFEIGS